MELLASGLLQFLAFLSDSSVCLYFSSARFNSYLSCQENIGLCSQTVYTRWPQMLTLPAASWAKYRLRCVSLCARATLESAGGKNSHGAPPTIVDHHNLTPTKNWKAKCVNLQWDFCPGAPSNCLPCTDWRIKAVISTRWTPYLFNN